MNFAKTGRAVLLPILIISTLAMSELECFEYGIENYEILGIRFLGSPQIEFVFDVLAA